MIGLVLGTTSAAMELGEAPPTVASAVAELEAFEQELEGATVTFRMVPVPGDGDDIKTLYMSATEVTWDLYDLYMFATTPDDKSSPKGADAVSGPSKPYLPPDRGFGHAGYPVLSTAHQAAQRFCDWLSERTGRSYRLPTEAEWKHACALNSQGAPSIDEFAWHAGNSNEKTHEAGSKKAGALGLYDMLGNTAEWVIAPDGKPTAMGGSYKDDAATLSCDTRQQQQRSWQMSDPQLPKSKWWLSDCGWVSFRIVCEVDAAPKD